MKTLAILCFVLGFAMLAWVAFHDKLEGLFPDSSETETTAIQEEENREEVQNQDTNPKSETVSDNQEDSGDRVMVVSKEFLEFSLLVYFSNLMSHFRKFHNDFSHIFINNIYIYI